MISVEIPCLNLVMNNAKLNNKRVHISQYNFDNKHVLKIKSLIEKKYTFLFKMVIIHGSLGTGEEIKYSDFDGLLIVKDQWIKSQELLAFKKKSFEIMLQCDPLQHHSWFELSESKLNNYPNNYLPVSVLNNSKMIFPAVSEMEFSVRLRDNVNYKEPLFTVLNSLELKIKKNWKPKNMFQLKSYLSQIMLIPCLFYSALHDKGLFKRESFEIMRPYFSDEEWKPIKLASKARLNWNYKLNMIQCIIMRRPERIFRIFTKKFISPKIDKEVFNFVIDEDFSHKLILFINKIKSHKDLQ